MDRLYTMHGVGDANDVPCAIDSRLMIEIKAPFHKKILTTIVIVNLYQEEKCASQKSKYYIMISSVFERK